MLRRQPLEDGVSLEELVSSKLLPREMKGQKVIDLFDDVLWRGLNKGGTSMGKYAHLEASDS